MAQRELEWQLECRKRELDLLRKKREDEIAVISAKDQAEAAQLESEMLGQEYNEGRDNEADKVSKPSSFLKHYLVPTPKETTEVESKDFKPGISQGYVSQELKGNVYLDRQAVTSYEHTPLCAVSKPPPVKNLEFHTAENSSLTLGSVQAPAAKACELHMVKFTTATLSPQQGLYSFQTTATSASLNVKPSLYGDLSPPGYVTVSQPKPGSFDKTSTPPLTTSVTWTTYPGPGGEIPPKVSSLVGGTSVMLSSTPGNGCHGNLAQAPHKSNFTAQLNHSQPSHLTQWAPAARGTSTPYFGGLSKNTSHPLQVEEPVDAFIDRLNEGHETVFQLNLTSLQADSSVALLRAHEQQRLPPLELFKFTGKSIEWPKFIERFRDQIHNKTTLTDLDRMAYLFQNLDGEAKKVVESLGVTGHSYPTALKTLKRQFGKQCGDSLSE